MSSIGLPKGMSRDAAYIQGMADGEQMARDELLKLGSFYCVECFEPIRSHRDVEEHAFQHMRGTEGLVACGVPPR